MDKIGVSNPSEMESEPAFISDNSRFHIAKVNILDNNPGKYLVYLHRIC